MIRKAIAVITDFSGGIDTRTPIISMGLNKSPNMRNFHCSGIKERLKQRLGFTKVNSSSVETDNLSAYYPPGYQTTDYALRDAAARTQISQGFKPDTSSTVTKVRLWLKKTGTPAGTDTVTAEIQTDSAGVPSGTAVTNGTSTAVDISDTITTSYAWVTFTFATAPSLTSGTQYHLVLQGAFTVSGVNYVMWGVDNFDIIYADGAMSVYDGTTWVTDSNYDACFEVYITGGGKGNDGVALYDFTSKNMLLGIYGTSLYKMDKDSAGTPDGIWDSVLGGSSWDTYTKSMLHFDGSDAATTFTDEIGKVWTAVGNAQLDTAQKKFGTASLLLDGTGDYITTPDSDDSNFAAGDFTIDCWARWNSLTGLQVFISQFTDSDNNWQFQKESDNSFTFFASSGGSTNRGYFYTAAQSLSINTWYHIEFCRSGSTAYFFLNGVSKALTQGVAWGTLPDLAVVVAIGAVNTGSTMNGWIDELRVSKGIARHTANFTPATAAYSAGVLALTSSRYWTFADWQSGRALINTDIGLYSYTGSGNAAIVTNAPISKFIVIFRNYVFAAGIRGLPNTVRYSDLSDYTTWTAAQTLSVNTNDGDVITGMRILKGKLYIFKRYSIHRISYVGSNPTFQVDQILGVGCPAHYTIKELELGGDIGTVLCFLTTDKKLSVFDGYNIQTINDSLTEETNDLFGVTDDQPLSFSDMNLVYSDLFHAVNKSDTSEYILYCVLGTDTSIGYAFVFDYKTGGIYPYDGQVFSSSTYAISTNKSKILYCAGYSGYMWEMESGNDDDGTAINAYWVSGKIKPSLVSMLTKALMLGINFKETSSGSTLNMDFQFRIDWNVSWTTAEQFVYNRADSLTYGKTALFDIGTIENMLQIKIKNNSSNPGITLYGMDLYGELLGLSVGERATA